MFTKVALVSSSHLRRSVRYFAEAANSAPQLYHELLHKSRGERKLAIRDLKAILLTCTTPDDVKYAKLAVELFQRKGSDFTEEVASLFVKSCVQGNNPMVVVDMCLQRQNRISAWQTGTSVQRLVDAICSTQSSGAEKADQLAKLVEAISIMAEKGVNILPTSMESVLAATTSVQTEAVYSEKIQPMLSQLVSSKFPSLNN